MAINPVLAQDQETADLFPLPQAGETFVLKRDNIVFEGRLPVGGKLWGRGVFFLTTKRIVFLVKSKANRQDFKSFEIPLARLDKPKFHQPIFGANYLGGRLEPLESEPAGSPLAGGATTVYLTFNSGGCGTFLPLFYQMMHQIHQEAEASQLIQAVEQGRLHQIAYVDPSDPSVLFLSQPTAAPTTGQQAEQTNAAG